MNKKRQRKLKRIQDTKKNISHRFLSCQNHLRHCHTYQGFFFPQTLEKKGKENSTPKALKQSFKNSGVCGVAFDRKHFPSSTKNDRGRRNESKTKHRKNAKIIRNIFVRLTDLECPLGKGSTNLCDDCPPPNPRPPSSSKRFLGSSSRPP
ncbi:hypothetical protein CEXT_11161 [Caerostris extrusa]|uniref:Uncharacterized protein n=1 Tax=Caerostris extrusa TaxID=172846 RepID=A0AAV4XG93_CAEEX|nr:hypothetical protein CEXT_11161 [Caerostris extrusa]